MSAAQAKEKAAKESTGKTKAQSRMDKTRDVYAELLDSVHLALHKVT